MTASVIGELVRASDAVAGAIWLADSRAGAAARRHGPTSSCTGGPTGWAVGDVVRIRAARAIRPIHEIPGGFAPSAWRAPG